MKTTKKNNITKNYNIRTVKNITNISEERIEIFQLDKRINLIIGKSNEFLNEGSKVI